MTELHPYLEFDMLHVTYDYIYILWKQMRKFFKRWAFKEVVTFRVMSTLSTAVQKGTQENMLK